MNFADRSLSTSHMNNEKRSDGQEGTPQIRQLKRKLKKLRKSVYENASRIEELKQTLEEMSTGEQRETDTPTQRTLEEPTSSSSETDDQTASASPAEQEDADPRPKQEPSGSSDDPPAGESLQDRGPTTGPSRGRKKDPEPQEVPEQEKEEEIPEAEVVRGKSSGKNRSKGTSKQKGVSGGHRRKERGKDRSGTVGDQQSEGSGSGFFQRMEQFLAGRGFLVIGVIAIFFAVGFGIKLITDRELISEELRVILGVAAGLSIIALGEWLVKKDLRYFSRGMFGLGLGILYFSFYAAFQFYEFLPQEGAGLCMIGTTVGGVWISLRHNSRLIAHLSLIGGFLTPLLVSTGEARTSALFSYVTLLLAGFLFLSVHRNWRYLDTAAMIGTGVLFVGWLLKHYSPDLNSTGAVFLCLFHLLIFASIFIKLRWTDREERIEEIHFFAIHVLTALGFYSMFSVDPAVRSHLKAGGFLFAEGVLLFVVTGFLRSEDRRNWHRAFYALSFYLLFAGGLLQLARDQFLLDSALLLGLVSLHLYYLFVRDRSNRSIVSSGQHWGFLAIGFVLLLRWTWHVAPDHSPLIVVGMATLVFAPGHLYSAVPVFRSGSSLRQPYRFLLEIVLFLAAGTFSFSGWSHHFPEVLQWVYPWFMGLTGLALLVEYHFGLFAGDRLFRMGLSALSLLSLVTAVVFYGTVLQGAPVVVLPLLLVVLAAHHVLTDYRGDRAHHVVNVTTAVFALKMILFHEPIPISFVTGQIVIAGFFALYFLVPTLPAFAGSKPLDRTGSVHLLVSIIGFFLLEQNFVRQFDTVIRPFVSFGYGYFLMAVASAYLLFRRRVRFYFLYLFPGMAAAGFGVFQLFSLDMTDRVVRAWLLFLLLILYTGLFPVLLDWMTGGFGQREESSGTNGWLDVVRSGFPLLSVAVTYIIYGMFYAGGIPVGLHVFHELFLTISTVGITSVYALYRVYGGVRIGRTGVITVQSNLVLFYMASLANAVGMTGVSDWMVPAVLAPVLFSLSCMLSQGMYEDRTQMKMFLLNGFVLTFHAILLAVSHQYQTILVASFASVFYALARRNRWKWIELGSLLAAAYMSGHAFYDVYTYHADVVMDQSAFPFLLRYVSPFFLIAMAVVHQYFPSEKLRDFFPEDSVSVPQALRMTAAVLLLYIGVVKICSVFGWTGSDIMSDRNMFMFVLSAYAGVSGIGYFLWGFYGEHTPIRVFGLGIISITVLKVFFVDLQVEMIWRVLSFLVVGLILIAVSFFYQNLIKEGDVLEWLK